VRPEHLHLAPVHRGEGSGDADAAGTLTGTLEIVEPVGNEIFLSVRTPIGPVICRVPPQAVPEVGGMLILHYASAQLLCFDAISGLRVQ